MLGKVILAIFIVYFMLITLTIFGVDIFSENIFSIPGIIFMVIYIPAILKMVDST